MKSREQAAFLAGEFGVTMAQAEQYLQLVRGIQVDRAIIIEPRFTSLESDRTYFTVSPLESADHLAMLDHLLESVMARRAGAPTETQGSAN